MLARPHTLGVVTERFRIAIWEYRRQGGKIYQLANQHHISPSTLSATITGARDVGYDERVAAIGVQLGLAVHEVFEGDTPDDDEVAAPAPAAV